jgi:hypothetical protein
MAKDEEDQRETEEPRRSGNGKATSSRAEKNERPRSEWTAMLMCLFGVLAYSIVMNMMSASSQVRLLTFLVSFPCFQPHTNANTTGLFAHSLREKYQCGRDSSRTYCPFFLFFHARQTSGLYEGLVALSRNYTVSPGTYELMWNNSIASEKISAMSEIGIGRAANDLVKAGQDMVLSATGLGGGQSDAQAKLPVLQPNPPPPPPDVPPPPPPPPPAAAAPAAAAAAAPSSAPAIQAVASHPLDAQGSQEGKDPGVGANGGSGEQEECVGIDGSEEGDWDKSKKYHLRGCKLRRVTAEEVVSRFFTLVKDTFKFCVDVYPISVFERPCCICEKDGHPIRFLCNLPNDMT